MEYIGQKLFAHSICAYILLPQTYSYNIINSSKKAPYK